MRVITNGGIDRGGQLCRCSRCGYEAICKIFDDFYTWDGDEFGLLYCERCIREPRKSKAREALERAR